MLRDSWSPRYRDDNEIPTPRLSLEVGILRDVFRRPACPPSQAPRPTYLHREVLPPPRGPNATDEPEQKSGVRARFLDGQFGGVGARFLNGQSNRGTIDGEGLSELGRPRRERSFVAGKVDAAYRANIWVGRSVGWLVGWSVG